MFLILALFRLLSLIFRSPGFLLVALLVAVMLVTGDVSNPPLDAATVAAVLWGVVSPLILKIAPWKGNAMLAATWGSTLVVALLAVLLLDGFQGFTLQKLLVDLMAAYSIQAGLFAAANQNLPSAVH